MGRKSQSGIQLSLLLLALVLSVSLAYAAASPVIHNASVEPLKVRPGDIMNISASVSDSAGISSVSAQMPHEKGFDIVDMFLSSGTAYSGTWAGQWLVHDTLLKNYTTKITARNIFGQESYAYVEWSDPSDYNISINLAPNPADAGQNVTVSGLVVNATSGAGLGNNIRIFLNGQNIIGNFTPAGESQALWQYRKAITINGSTSGQADYRDKDTLEF